MFYMKKGALTLLFLNLIGFASAYSSYSNFSIGDLFYNLNPDDVFLIVIFGLFSFFLVKAFKKVFGGRIGLSKGSWVPAILLSFGLTYGIYTTNFSITDFFYSLGLSQGVLETVLWIVGIGLFILCIVKKWLGYLFLLVGASMISFAIIMDWYQKGAAIVIGIVSIIIGIVLLKFRKKGKERNSPFLNDLPYTSHHKPKKNYNQEKEILKQRRKQEKLQRKLKQREYKDRMQAHEKEKIRRVKNITKLRKEKLKRDERRIEARKRKLQKLAEKGLANYDKTRNQNL